MTTNQATGFTLIEIMITIAVLAIMLLAALPSFTVWLANTQVRTAGEAVLNGLQLARAEAIRRNRNIELRMDVSSGWTVTIPGTFPEEVIQSRLAAEGSRAAVVTIAPAGATRITFDGFGSIAANTDGTPAITEIKLDSPSLAPADSRRLCVLVRAGGNVRLCDPQVFPPDTRTCGAVPPAGC